jgi:hypothetical protein
MVNAAAVEVDLADFEAVVSAMEDRYVVSRGR